LYKHEEEYMQGEMWHSAQRAEISEEKWIYVCMYVPACALPGNGYMTHISGNQKGGIVDSYAKVP
jgi:hypothetical protein